MSGIRKLQNRVETYRKRYRLKGLKISDLYDLESSDWAKPYPFCFDSGVYVILNKQKKVLYVGKASINNNIGSRLGSYFKYAKDRTCTTMPDHNWTNPPSGSRLTKESE